MHRINVGSGVNASALDGFVRAKTIGGRAGSQWRPNAKRYFSLPTAHEPHQPRAMAFSPDGKARGSIAQPGHGCPSAICPLATACERDLCPTSHLRTVRTGILAVG